MKRICLFALPLSIAACGGSSLDAIRNGLPTSDTVHLSVPARSGQALEDVGQQQQAVRGETSSFYRLTRDVTGVVNLGTAVVLGLVKAVTDNPPTSFSGNLAIWGPYTDPLSPNTYRLTATDNGHHQYSYALEGKAKQAPDSAYIIILSGVHVAATDSSGHPIRGFGSGSFLIDWDKAQTLPEHDANVGTGAFSYSRTSAAAPVEINVTFTQVRDLISQQLINVNYKYVQAPAADGMFQFSTYQRNSSGNLQRLAIESRWKQTGAGRSDVVLNPGSPPPTINECWDSLFTSQYLHVSYDASQNYGVEASDCVFATAEYSTL